VRNTSHGGRDPALSINLCPEFGPAMASCWLSIKHIDSDGCVCSDPCGPSAPPGATEVTLSYALKPHGLVNGICALNVAHSEGKVRSTRGFLSCRMTVSASGHGLTRT
jgi:hypothetical protein